MSAAGCTVMIMAGGTGGHVFPALAVARELTAAGAAVVWLGTRRGLEARVVPRVPLPVAWIRVSGLRGKGPLKVLLAPLMLAVAAAQALVILLRVRPRAVLGMGGFVTGPAGVMAWLLRRPLLVHEQNAVAGLTNRLLAPLARRVMEAFPGTLPAALDTGNPVRADIAALPAPAERGVGGRDQIRLLVLGGSLGARSLNETVPAALARLDPARRPRVRHQAGSRTLEAARAAYAAAGVEAEVSAFIEDMAEAYAWADLVVCRAGALTVAELAAAGVGAVLVPYPHAVDDHQTVNARYLTEAGAARVIADEALSAEGLAGELAGLLADGGRLLDMARRARARARPDAARAVARECLVAAGCAEVAP